ncbi:CHASE4 domain-containing protein [Aidingimonas lacisalsi]|uniref:CHASE4 domain-containing protein n=1 Tax=Aidingimonas lacisalsi TaxID=2604086 RepID=UPI001375DDB3|nr:CHASE4 domain-containing protein [Aidingimonas lacisalsi]
MTSLPSSLRNRFLLALSVLLLTASLALVLIGRFVIYPALLDEEREQATSELDKIERTILHDQRALLAQAKDWATWDDTYAFIQGEHAGYAASNFSQAMFEDMDYQLMLFFTSEKAIYWSAGIDPASGHYASCAGFTVACEWASPFADGLDALLDAHPESGVTRIMVEPAPTLVALYPILRTDESGPSRGWLANVRLLDDAWLEALEARTGRPVDIMPIAVGDTRQGLQLDRSDSDRMTISRPLALHGEQTPLRLQSQIPRDSFRTSMATFRYGLLWTAGLLLVVIALVLILLERMVLRPLRRFAHVTQQLQHDNESHLFPVELLTRRDEIGTLAREFQALREHQRQQQALLVEISQHDPLTGLANRRLFDERLQRAYDQAVIHGKPLRP